jgi:predicted RNA methylase
LKFCRLAAYNVAYYVRHPRGSDELDPHGRSFDAALGIDTTSIREVGTLEIDSPNVRHAVRYQATSVDLVRKILAESGIRYEDCVFIDFGCGKGRVMLLAAEFPFRRILGVEFSPELYEIARRNIAACASQFRGCRNVDAILADAGRFVPPDDPLVCYFYNPFGETVMRNVVENLEQSRRKVSRPIWIVYVDPMHRNVFEDRGWIQRKEQHPYVIYEKRS